LYASGYTRNHNTKITSKNEKPMEIMDLSHGSSDDDSVAGSMSANGELEELEEGGGLTPDNAIIAVPIGFQFQFQLKLLSSEETRHHITRKEVDAGDKDEASLDTNISQGTMETLVTLGREMREITILAADESLPDAAPDDVYLHVKNDGSDETSRVRTITQATFKSSAAGFEALAQYLSQQRNPDPFSLVLEEDPLTAPLSTNKKYKHNSTSE
jgi:hypothetical protein